MTTSWNAISSTQQAQILQALGVESLPDMSALNELQKTIVAGIVGMETIEQGMMASAPQGTLAAPRLDPPKQGDDWESLMLRLAEIRLTLDEQQVKITAESLKGARDDHKAASAEQTKKLQESIKKLNDVANKSLLSKIFGWLSTALTFIGACLSAAVLGPAAIPGILMAGLALAVQILGETGTMDIIMEKFAAGIQMLFQAMGIELSDAAAMAIAQIVVAAAMILMCVGSAAVSAKMMASRLIDAGKKGLELTVNQLKVMQVSNLSGGFGVVTGLVGTGTGIDTALSSYDATKYQAQSKEIQAFIARLTQMMSEESERLQELIQKMNQGVVDASDILSSMFQSKQRTISCM